MRGASTITQQLVKNLYLNRDRTFGRKIKELIMSLMIERYTDKHKILEMYLNVIEYGKGLYGIGAASKYYFNKNPMNLNAREAAFLAMLLLVLRSIRSLFKIEGLLLCKSYNCLYITQNAPGGLYWRGRVSDSA